MATPSSPATPSESSDSSPVDWQSALERVAGNRDALIDLIETLFEECPSLLDAIRSATSDRDGERLQRAAHTLKGSLEVFGASEAADAARELETLGEQEDFDGAEDNIEPLEHQLRRVVAALADRTELDPPDELA